MSGEISFPITLGELEQGETLGYGFDVGEVWDASDFDTEETRNKIEDIADFDIESLGDNDDFTSKQIINSTYCMTKYFKEMSSENRESFVECMLAKVGNFLDIIEGGGEVNNSSSNSNNNFDKKTKDFFKIYLFLFAHSVSAVEDVIAEETAVVEAALVPVGKGKKKKATAPVAGAMDWVTLRNACLVTMERSLTVPSNYLWAMGSVHENFLSIHWQYVVKILEAKPVGVKTGLGGFDKEVRSRCLRIMSKCVAAFGSPESSGSYPTLVSSLLEALMRTEHMSAVTAEICQACTPMLTREFLEEVSSINDGKTQTATAGMKNIGIFIEDLARFNSSTMIANLPIIMKQLDSDAHQVRSSLLAALAHIVIILDKSLKGDSTAVAAVSEAKPDGEEEDEGETKNNETEAGDGDGVHSNKTRTPRLRDTILDVIVERTHDTSPYTRAAVLRVWHTLLAASAVPVRRLGNVAEIAYDRLFDKAQAVRKNALTLMSAVLEHNPYGSDLDNLKFARQKLIFEAKLAERIEQLKNQHLAAMAASMVVPVAEEAPAPVESVGGGEEKEGGEGMQVTTEGEAEQPKQEQSEQPTPEVEEEEFDMDAFLDLPDVKEDSDVVALRHGLDYATSALEVIATLIVAATRVKAMLKSKSAAEVVEALKFITQLVNFSVRGSIQLYFKSADLIFHADKAIVTECKNAFRNIFLLNGDSLLPPKEISENLMNVFAQCKPEYKQAVEEIVTNMFSSEGNGSGVDDVAVSSCLWSVVSSAEADSPKTGTALRILTLMAMNSDVEDKVVALSWSRVSTVIRSGMSAKTIAHFNFDAVQAAARFLQLVPRDDVSFDMETDKGQTFSSAVERFVCVIMGEMCGDSEHQSSRWFSACEECVQALFHLHPSPDKVMARAVAGMYATLSSTLHAEKHVVCSNARLSRFFFVLGQTALNSLVLAEDLSQATRSAKLMAQKDAIAAEQAVRGTKKVGEQEAEHDAEMTAGIDMEVESELFSSMNLGMLVENLLAKFVPMVAAVVASEDAAAAGSYASPMLRQTATLSLCKFMSVSATLCDQYLPLLFTSLENNTDDICRTTVMVAIGDLMSRFPNALEQWTQYIYARLCDNSTVVRYNALMVLTHMLLNDMVKVKGQVVNVVLCLSDTDERIRDLSRLFFLKLAERSTNPLHNQMGEVIATIAREMSNGERGMLHTADGGADPSPVGSKRKVLTSAQYGTTLDFLLSFVKVIKQADALLERTLPRLILAKDPVQKRALAQCLGKLTISPKGVKKVGESVKSLKDALCDEEVYSCLLACVRGVKKSSAVGATSALTEDEKKACKEVEDEIVKVGKEVHLNGEDEEEEEGMGDGDGSAETQETQELLHDLKKTRDDMAVDGEDFANENEAPAASKSTKRGASSKKAATPAKKTAAAKKTPVKAAAASKPKGRASRKKVIVDSEDEEEEEAVEEEEVAPRSRRARKPLAASN